MWAPGLAQPYPSPLSVTLQRRHPHNPQSSSPPAGISFLAKYQARGRVTQQLRDDALVTSWTNQTLSLLQRPVSASGVENQKPDVVHKTAIGGGAMIPDKYGAVAGLPIALRSTGTAQDEVRLKDSALPHTKHRGSAVLLCVKSSAT